MPPSPLLSTILERAEAAASQASARSHLGTAVRLRGVQRSAEFLRVAGLPARGWSPEDAAELARDLTSTLRTPHGTMALLPLQAVALGEALLQGGAFCPLGVGRGKTLITLLAPTLLCAVRPLLLVPGALVEKTERDARAYAVHWRVHPGIRVVSYQTLGRVGAAELLDMYRPDLITADEAHKLKNPRAACTRRVTRYMGTPAGKACKFMPLSGTVTKRSLFNYAHLLSWALRDEAPIPLRFTDLEAWAAALDERVNAMSRYAPGALLDFATEEERKTHEPITAARLGYRRRLTATPGVVASAETEECEASLQISCAVVPPTPKVDETIRHLRAKWETPDGWPLAEAPAVWRCARELALGFHYVWDPRPPKEWVEAKKQWCAFVREIIKNGRKALDSEYQIALACSRGQLPADAYHEWAEIRDTFKPNTVPVWHCHSALEAAAKWLASNPGLAWVEHREFGIELSKLSGVPYFAAQGLDDRGVYVEDHDGPAILSIAANTEGRNLQHKWSQNLICAPPPDGTRWEQMLGRTHRPGQEADEVTAHVEIRCAEHYRGILQARSDALHVHQTLGQSQKMLIADLTIPVESAILGLSRFAAFSQ